MKKIISFCFMVLFIFGSAISISSSTNDAYYDFELDAYVVDLETISGEETLDSDDNDLKKLNSISVEPFDISHETFTYGYSNKKTTNYNGKAIRVSNNLKCNATSCKLGTTQSKSITSTISAGLSTGELSKLKANIGISLSAAKVQSVSYDWNIKKGQTAYIVFVPQKVRKDGVAESVTNFV